MAISTLGLALLLGGVPLGCGDKDDTGTDDSGVHDGGTDEAVAWTIDHHLGLCNGEGQWLCPRGKRDGAGEWEEIPCGIDGLDYAWGTTYSLRARVTGFSDPAVDGCGDKYGLVAIDAQTFDGGGVAFELVGIYGALLTPAEGGGTLAGGHAFLCDSVKVCEELAAIPTDWSTTWTLSMRNPDVAGAPLWLVSIEER